MKTFAGFVIAGGAIVLLVAVHAQANTLGSGFAGSEIGIIRAGDAATRDIDSSILAYGVVINVPVLSNLDVIADAERRELRGRVEGVNISGDTDRVAVGARAHILAKEPFNPFWDASLLWSRVETKTGQDKDKGDDVGFRVGSGVEINVSPALSFLVGLSYYDVLDEDGFVGNAWMHYWAIDELMFFARYRYDFDSDDQRISGGLAFRF